MSYDPAEHQCTCPMHRSADDPFYICTFCEREEEQRSFEESGLAAEARYDAGYFAGYRAALVDIREASDGLFTAQSDALAAGSRRAKTPKAVECEASQSADDSRNAPEQPR